MERELLAYQSVLAGAREQRLDRAVLGLEGHGLVHRPRPDTKEQNTQFTTLRDGITDVGNSVSERNPIRRAGRKICLASEDALDAPGFHFRGDGEPTDRLWVLVHVNGEVEADRQSCHIDVHGAEDALFAASGTRHADVAEFTTTRHILEGRRRRVDRQSFAHREDTESISVCPGFVARRYRRRGEDAQGDLLGKPEPAHADVRLDAGADGSRRKRHATAGHHEIVATGAVLPEGAGNRLPAHRHRPFIDEEAAGAAKTRNDHGREAQASEQRTRGAAVLARDLDGVEGEPVARHHLRRQLRPGRQDPETDRSCRVGRIRRVGRIGGVGGIRRVGRIRRIRRSVGQRGRSTTTAGHEDQRQQPGANQFHEVHELLL